MRLGRDRAVAHRAGGEALDDLADRLDLVDRYRGATGLLRRELEQPAQRTAGAVELIDLLRVFGEHLVAPLAGGVLEQEYRLRVEQVQLALTPPLVFAAHLEPAVCLRGRHERVGGGVPGRGLLGEFGEADAPEPRRCAAEVLVEQRLSQSRRLEDLGAGIRRDGRDAHLGHHLQHALAQRLDVVVHRLLGGERSDRPRRHQVVDRLERQVRVHRGRAVSDQQRDVVHLPSLAGLDDQADLGALPGADQVLVHRRDEQQRRDRGMVGVTVPVGQDEDARTGVDRGRALAAHPLDRGGERLAAAVDAEPSVDQLAGEAGHVAVGVDVPDLREFVVVQHRARDDDLPAGRRAGVEQVPFRADRAGQGGDHLLTDGVQRRIGDLREQLAEVVEHQPRPLREHCERRVGAHRADRLGAGARHRRDEHAQLLLGVAEDLLPSGDRLVAEHDVLALGQVGELDQPGVQPFAVGALGGQLCLDLLVGADRAPRGVDQEHAPGLQPALGDDGARVDVEHARLAA